MDGISISEELRQVITGQNPPDEEDKELRFKARWDGKEWLYTEWKEISSILKSRHYQIWQARVVWLLTIAAFVGLAAKEVLDKALSLLFIILLTSFMILVDAKYQKIKQILYERASKLEAILGFRVYRRFTEKSDKLQYAALLWIFLLASIAVWYVVGCLIVD